MRQKHFRSKFVDKKLQNRLLALLTLGVLMVSVQTVNFSAKAETQDEVRIFGQVNNPLNLTHAELLSLQLVSEIATLECVFGSPKVTSNWTGVPIFHLLTLAEAKPVAQEVVFRASDGFSSSLLIEDAIKPYVILALEVDGIVQSNFRVVVPCKYGFKWVTDIIEIEVVDYDYNGTYESTFGYTEEQANVPDCTPPQITPPLQSFNLSFGTRSFQVEAFTNASLMTFSFDYTQKEITLNFTVPAETTGFANLILPQSLLKRPYLVSLDENTVNVTEANVADFSFLNIVLFEGTHTVQIVGTEFFGSIPEITVAFKQIVYVGETVAFNASSSIDDGQIVLYEWDFGDGFTGNGSIVYHSYSQEGTYQISLNVTDYDGLSNQKLFSITVKKPQQGIPLSLSALLVAISVLLALLFAAMLLKRKTKLETKDT